MSRTLFFDCFAGVAGDMTVGALLDLGLDLDYLREELSKLGLAGVDLRAERVRRGGFAATRFSVESPDPQPFRKLADIRALIDSSRLKPGVKARALRAFELLAAAEARVHGATIDSVHFHEVGAVDALVDVVGAMIGFDWLGIERFVCSPLRVGHGSIEAAHGRLSVPAPGTAELLRGCPVYAGEVEGEFVTPTGAAIVRSLCAEFRGLPSLTIERIGYGAGARDPDSLPNVLRLIVGTVGAADRAAIDRVFVIETNIDDMNPQAYGFLMERVLSAGALDMFVSPVQMKKDRPGMVVTVLCKPEELDSLCRMLLLETTSLGVRYHEVRRRVLDRVVRQVETRYGRVRVKVALEGARTVHFQPEFEDCARLAREASVSLIEVQSAASAAYRVEWMNGKENDKPG